MSEEQHTDQLNKTLHYSVEQFGKTILYIASGSLGISFAFIKDIIPNLKEAKEISSLIFSWYIFGIVIFISLVCHFISVLANTWAIKHSDLKPKIFNQKINGWNIPIRILNLLMIVGILIGAFFLFNFIEINLIKE